MLRRLSITTVHVMCSVALAVSMMLLGSVAKAQQTPEAQSDNAELVSGNGTSQTKERAKELAATDKPATIPVSHDFMGVRLGMSADEVRETLGKLKDKGKSQDLFVFSDVHSAQVHYDDQAKVIALSIDYIGTKSEAPMPEKVLGESLRAKPDGSMYQLKRYPDAGYWVAYSRTAGEDPITTVTIQKM